MNNAPRQGARVISPGLILVVSLAIQLFLYQSLEAVKGRHLCGLLLRLGSSSKDGHTSHTSVAFDYLPKALPQTALKRHNKKSA